MSSDNQVLEICKTYGLSVGSIDVDNDVLVLQPYDLENLPSAHEMRVIADELKALGHRWVSLDISELA